jgi:hypothetical protein
LLADPQRARSIGESGRQLVLRDFGVAKMVSRTAELYREVLSESKVPALSGAQSVETGSRVSITRTQ